MLDFFLSFIKSFVEWINSYRARKDERSTKLSEVLYATEDLLNLLIKKDGKGITLDDRIFIKKTFTCKQRILDSLNAVIKYWRNNESALRKNLKH